MSYVIMIFDEKFILIICFVYIMFVLLFYFIDYYDNIIEWMWIWMINGLIWNMKFIYLYWCVMLINFVYDVCYKLIDMWRNNWLIDIYKMLCDNNR